MGCCAKAHLQSKWALFKVNNLLTTKGSLDLMARTALSKNENRRVRSFNLDDEHYRELKRLAQVEGLSMSDIINRVLWHGFAKKKALQDIENGIQTTLEVHIQDAVARKGNLKNKRILQEKCNPMSRLGHCKLCWGEKV